MAYELGDKARKLVGFWLMLGVLMVFVQILIGGITRLTGSGLSITKWEIVTGTIPPTNAEAWEEAFDLYKATPQYQLINKGMSMSSFKFIYFWEYIHRFWARLMGIVFAIPFFYFLYKKMLPRKLIIRLVIVILLTVLVASFGWIMVASGLVDKPWVAPYKLTAHLGLALTVFSYLLWVALSVLRKPGYFVKAGSVLKNAAFGLLLVLAVQIILGGMMSGMKAGLNYPTWPKMGGEWIPAALFESSWSFNAFFTNEISTFSVAFVQFFHRLTAYVVTVYIIAFFVMGMKKVQDPALRKGFVFLLIVLFLQVILGIATVVSSKGIIPVDLGTYHQAGAVFLLGAVIFINYHLVNNVEPSVRKKRRSLETHHI